MVRDKIDGYSFEPDNYDSFKDKLEYIYAHPEQAHKVGLAGIKRGKEVFNPDKNAAGFYKFIDEIVRTQKN
jgi:glycosyltransferase involved in cell wall biosynthesis